MLVLSITYKIKYNIFLDILPHTPTGLKSLNSGISLKGCQNLTA